METGARMCAFRRRGHWSSALFRLVLLQHCAHVRSRFSGIVCNQRTDASEHRPLSLFLSPSFFRVFPASSSPFFHGRDRGRVYSCGEYVIPRKGFEFLSGEIVFHLSLRFVVAFGNACYTLEKIQLWVTLHLLRFQECRCASGESCFAQTDWIFLAIGTWIYV